MGTIEKLTLSKIKEHTKISFTYKDVCLFGSVWNQNKDYFFAYVEIEFNPTFFKYPYRFMHIPECDVKDIFIL